MILKLKNTNFISIKAFFSINDLDINEIGACNMFTFGKQDFKIFIVYKGNKEIRTLCILFLEMSIYKGYSDKTKCMYPMTKVKKKNLIVNLYAIKTT